MLTMFKMQLINDLYFYRYNTFQFIFFTVEQYLEEIHSDQLLQAYD